MLPYHYLSLLPLTVLSFSLIHVSTTPLFSPTTPSRLFLAFLLYSLNSPSHLPSILFLIYLPPLFPHTFPPYCPSHSSLFSSLNPPSHPLIPPTSPWRPFVTLLPSLSVTPLYPQFLIFPLPTVSLHTFFLDAFHLPASLPHGCSSLSYLRRSLYQFISFSPFLPSFLPYHIAKLFLSFLHSHFASP